MGAWKQAIFLCLVGVVVGGVRGAPPAAGVVVAARPAVGLILEREMPPEFDLAGVIKDANGPRPKPVNGVTLRIYPEVARRGANNELHVDWVVAYTGRRSPLTILAPSLEEPTSSTELTVFAVSKNKKCFGVSYRSPFIPDDVGINPLNDKWFKTSTDDTIKDSIKLSIGDIKDRLTGLLPSEYDAGHPPLIYLRLNLNTEQRGDSANIDAWTGSVTSGAVKLNIKNW